MKGQRFKSLDGLRGVCALMIAIFHCDLALNSAPLLSHAFLCVDIFFVLSGFVIGLTYESRLNGGLGLRNFSTMRAHRLLPVHWLATTTVAAILLTAFFSGKLLVPTIHGTSMVVAALLGLCLLPDYWLPLDIAFPINTPLWSLMDEWVANLVYAGFLYRWRTRHLSMVTAILCGFAFCYAFWNPNGLSIGMRKSDLWPGAANALGQFLIGVTIFRFYALGSFKKLPKVRPELIYSLSFLMAAVPRAYPTPVYDVCAIALIPCGIIALLNSKEPAKCFTWLGSISYPLYAVQFALIYLVKCFLLNDGQKHSVLLAIPIIAGDLLLAWVIMYLTSSARMLGTLQKTNLTA